MNCNLYAYLFEGKAIRNLMDLAWASANNSSEVFAFFSVSMETQSECVKY